MREESSETIYVDVLGHQVRAFDVLANSVLPGGVYVFIRTSLGRVHVASAAPEQVGASR